MGEQTSKTHLSQLRGRVVGDVRRTHGLGFRVDRLCGHQTVIVASVHAKQIRCRIWRRCGRCGAEPCGRSHGEDGKFNEQFFQIKTTSCCLAHTYRTFSRSSPSMGTCSDWRLLHTNRYSHSAAVPGDPAEQIRSDDCRTRMSCSWCCGREGIRFRIQHVWVVVGGAFNSLEGVLSELFAGSHVHGARY